MSFAGSATAAAPGFPSERRSGDAEARGFQAASLLQLPALLHFAACARNAGKASPVMERSDT